MHFAKTALFLEQAGRSRLDSRVESSIIHLGGGGGRRLQTDDDDHFLLRTPLLLIAWQAGAVGISIVKRDGDTPVDGPDTRARARSSCLWSLARTRVSTPFEIDF